jgi:type IV secretion system protein VirB1
MSTTIAALIATCAPAVHPTTMHALIQIESAANPYAVSINRPQTWLDAGIDPPSFAQPRTARDARRLVSSLHAQGFTTSVGLAQINTEHLTHWRVPLTALLDPCTNLKFAERVLLDCDRDARERPSKLPRVYQTLSCYNSGNASTGLANGYVSSIQRSARRVAITATPPRIPATVRPAKP